MIEMIDGFDVVDEIGARLKWNGFNATFIQAICIAGRPGPPNSGSNGQSYFLFNTAFGQAELVHIWGQQNTFGFHMDWRILTPTQNRQAEPIDERVMEWCRFGTDSETYLVIALNGAGTMEFRAGDGTHIDSPRFTFYYDTWYTLEGKFGFGSMGGGYEFRVNQVTVAKSGSPISPARPDRISLRWQGFGPPGLNIDNVVLWDDRTGDVTDFLGPCRITTLWPARDVNSTWIIGPFPGAHRFEQIADLPFNPDGTHPPDPNGAPDGDSSYLMQSPTSSLIQFYYMSQAFNRLVSPCFGLNLCIAINATCRPLLDGEAVEMVFQPLNVRYTLATLGGYEKVGQKFTKGQRNNVDNYSTRQQVIDLSPATGRAWNDAEISTAYWGLGQFSTKHIQVTQVYLEKLTTLLNKPFSCGGSNITQIVH